MNYDKFGIVITFMILFGVCGFAGIASGEFINIGIPEISLGQSSPTVDTSNDGYYDWCYRMGYDC